MSFTEPIDYDIQKYYDGQMNDKEIIHFEARIALSKVMRDYIEAELYKNFKISNSIRLVKMRIENKKLNFADMLSKPMKKGLFFDNNSVIFKSFNKLTGKLFLSVNRHNS